VKLAPLIFVLALAPTLFAHPLDDKAAMVSELALIDNTRLELSLEFRYQDVRASYSEFAAGLDRNQDGAVTREELKLRYFELIDPIALAITVTVDGRPVSLEPDLTRFEFRDLNNDKASVDAQGGLPVQSSRIFYKFVLTGQVEPGPGRHEVEYFFSGAQTVIHNPALQLLPVDARGGRKPVEGAAWDTEQGGMPRVKFAWQIGPVPEAQPAANEAPADTPVATPATEPQNLRGLGEVPAWLTLVAGAALVIVAAALALRRVLVRTSKTRLSNALMLGFAGLAIILGALMRLGIIRTL